MNIRQLLLTTATTALLLSPAYSAIKLDEIVVKGPTWNPLDSGRNDYNSRQINTYLTPNQDFKDLFRTDTNVQFNDSYKKDLRQSGDVDLSHDYKKQQWYTQKVLDQRPQGISISGGRFYENNLTVDGRYSSSKLTPNLRELSEAKSGAMGHIRGLRRAGSLNRTTDSFWVKPFDVEKAKIYDSNVPAKYGKFAGGVIDVETKKPTGKQNFTVYYDVAGSKWESIKNYGTATPHIEKKWTSYSLGGRFNSNEYTIKDDVKLSLAVGADRSRRTAASPRNAFYKRLGREVPAKMNSISENKDIKGKFKFRHDTEVDVTLNNQNYSIDNFPRFDNAAYVMDVEKRVGDVMSVTMNKKLTGGRTVNVSLSTTSNKMQRTSLTGWDLYDHSYSFLKDSNDKQTHGSFRANCGTTALTYTENGTDFSKDCQIGGYGDADETEKKQLLNVTYGMPSKWGRLEFGTSLEHDDLQFNRNQDSNYYYHKGIYDVSGIDSGKINSRKSKWNGQTDSATNTNFAKLKFLGDKVTCETESDSCKNGQYAFYYRERHQKKNVKFTGTERNAYMQLTRKVPYVPFDMKMRAGIRYDYDTLLKNNVFAPRLSLSHKINAFGEPWATTYGINRYYANSNATYHLLSKAVGAYTREYRKVKYVATGEKTLWTDEWFNKDGSAAGAEYKTANLKTPYSDEFSVATQSPEFGVGQFRFKYINRHSRDEFASSGSNPDKMTNDGRSKYRALNIEYQKTWGANTFFANTTFSSTKRNATSFIAQTKEKYDTEIVAYKGKTYKKSDINKKAAHYNRPQIYNFGYSRNIQVGGWGDVMAGITGQYTQSYTKIEPIYFNNGNDQDRQTIGGTAYDAYGDVKYPSRTDINGNISWNIKRNGDDTGVSVYTGINNLFNKRYEGPENGKVKSGIFRGRAFTFGTQVSF